eukprot:2936-Heterococcus_DN1.PRE.2
MNCTPCCLASHEQKEMIQFSLAVAVLRGDWSETGGFTANTNLTALSTPPEPQAIKSLIRRAQANMLEGMARGSKRQRSGQLPPQHTRVDCVITCEVTHERCNALCWVHVGATALTISA